MFGTSNDQNRPDQKLATCSGITGAGFSIPQPPLKESYHSQPPSRDRTCMEIEEVDNVRELRQQVQILNRELRELRTAFHGSMQQLNSGGQELRAVRNSSGVEKINKSMDEDESIPPLPPRLYRPTKPERTFAHGSTSITDVPYHVRTSHSNPPRLGSTQSLNCINEDNCFPSSSTIHQRGGSTYFAKPLPPPPPLPPPKPPLLPPPPLLLRPPPPPPPSTAHQRPRWTTKDHVTSIPATSTDYLVPPSRPPLPPKPVSTTGETIRIGSRQRPNPNSRNRQSQIHTNGSISAVNSPPPKYQIRPPVSLEPNKECTSTSAFPPRPYIGTGTVEAASTGRNKKETDLNALLRLNDLTAEPMSDRNLVDSIAGAFERGVCWYELGPVLVFLNSFNNLASSVPSASVNEPPATLINIARDVKQRFLDGEYSQTIIFGGECGSGKTHLSYQLIQALFRRFSGHNHHISFLLVTGPCKEFNAAITVLRSLTSVRTRLQCWSSKAAFLYELHVSSLSVHKVKIHCCLLDQHHPFRSPDNESNYEIFYELMSGLRPEEKTKFHLSAHTLDSLHYLKSSLVDRNHSNDKSLFDQFRSSLSVLGIPFADIIRVLAAVMLMRNVRFVEYAEEKSGMKVENCRDLDSAAALLGITSSAFFKALTSRRTEKKGEMLEIPSCTASANEAVSSLATVLYRRCVESIIRRANNPQTDRGDQSYDPARSDQSKNISPAGGRNARPASGISSSDESSAHDSGFGKESPCANHSNDGISGHSSQINGTISVIDWFGFSSETINHFDQLCSNYAAERLQQLYQRILFKQNEELAIQEGIELGFSWRSSDNKIPNGSVCFPLLDVFQFLNKHCNGSGEGNVCPALKERYKNSKHIQVQGSPKCTLLVRHYGGAERNYVNIDDYPMRNRTRLDNELTSIFSPRTCNFCFASYLFRPDQRINQDYPGPAENSPAQHDLSRGKQEQRCNDYTSPQNFSMEIESILASLSDSNLRFVHCIKPNARVQYMHFDPDLIMEQFSRLDVFTTTRMIHTGLPYVIKLKEFIDRYRFLSPQVFASRVAWTKVDEAKALFDCYLRAVDDSNLPYVFNHWKIGTNHIFLSDGAKRQLDLLRDRYRNRAASVIQRSLREWFRNRKRTTSNSFESHPTHSRSVSNHSQSADHAASVSLVPSQVPVTPRQPPPLPSFRHYTVHMGKKIHFPQKRVFRCKYKDRSSPTAFNEGETVTAIGPGPAKGQLLIRDRSQGQNSPCSVVPEHYTKISLPTDYGPTIHNGYT